MEEIKIGSHVGMAGKEMFLASVKEAESYGAKCVDALYGCTTEYPQKRNQRSEY